MMKKTALVVLAAGIGSRFGGGIKQLEPVGPSGEIIMDYSIHDALEAGFNKVVFIIRRDLDEDFRRVIGDRIEKVCEVAYAYQELDDLPEGFAVPEGRKKPWGTGQAILAARDVIKEPFVVVNADDYYGKESFKIVHAALVADDGEEKDGVLNICMAGFVLKNTLSENGGVTRGICGKNEADELVSICETKNIVKTDDGAAVLSDGVLSPVDPESLVSMNMWGLKPEFLDSLKKGFPEFLSAVPEGNLTAEYLLPTIIDGLIRDGSARVRVLRTEDVWFGVTYQEDKDNVKKEFRRLVAEGAYRTPLF